MAFIYNLNIYLLHLFHSIVVVRTPAAGVVEEGSVVVHALTEICIVATNVRVEQRRPVVRI